MGDEAVAEPLAGTGLTGDPLTGDPLTGTGLIADPLAGAPLTADPFELTGVDVPMDGIPLTADPFEVTAWDAMPDGPAAGTGTLPAGLIFAADGIITAIFVGITRPGGGWVARKRISASNCCAVWSIRDGSAFWSNCSDNWDISSFSRSMLGT